MKRVVIEVSGGNLVGVFSDDDDLSISLIDWDNQPEESGEKDFRFPASKLSEMAPETKLLLLP